MSWTARRKSVAAGNLGEFTAQSRDHLVRGDVTLAHRLERYEKESGVGLSTTGEADYGVDRRILPHDLLELLHLLPHQLEGDALVSLNVSDNSAGVLLGENSLRHLKVEKNVDCDRRK